MKKNEMTLFEIDAFRKLHCINCGNTCKSFKKIKECIISFIDFVNDYREELLEKKER